MSPISGTRMEIVRYSCKPGKGNDDEAGWQALYCRAAAPLIGHLKD